MSFWDRLFGADPRPNRGEAILINAEIEQAIEESRTADAESERQTASLLQRIDRLELVIEGLICELEARGGLSIPDLREQIRALDLLDGAEDDRLSAEIPRRLDPVVEDE